ncbi:MAG TPA: tetratricopeptide repeat protein [Bryobacteraceae bacterium]|nr:tetratricopeptide repeat protein [Bryobacteraceae bacterium]
MANSLAGPQWRNSSMPSGKIMITGTVKLEDGSPLPGSAAIKLVCGGAERTVAHTSILDDFGFETAALTDSGASGVVNGWNSLNSANGDASSGTHTNVNGNLNCDLRAELTGFSSSTINMNNPSAFDGSDVGVIWLHRLAHSNQNIVSITTLTAPKEAKKNFAQARDLMRVGKTKEAVTRYAKAVKIDPQFAEAWVGLGFAQYWMNSSDAAEKSVLTARDIDPKLPGIYQILGYIASDRKDWNTSAQYLSEAERLDPMASALPWFVSAVAYYQLHRFHDAETSIRQEMQLDTQHHYRRAQFLLGLILVARNEVAPGAQVLREYLASSPDPVDVTPANAMLRRISTLNAKK